MKRLHMTQATADFLTAASNVLFAGALWPTVAANSPPEAFTSAATIVALLMLTSVLIHFKLWWGTFWNLVCTGMWVALLVQAL